MALLRTEDDIDDHICMVMSEPTDNTLGFVSRASDQLDLGDVNIEQSLSLLYQHSTGGVVWKTTPRFAEWIRESPLKHLVHKKTVVELGCGTGALAVLIHDFAVKIIATDQKPLLKLAHRNCEGLRNVEIQEFDWEKQEFAGVQDDGTIIACDTIYNDFLIEPFSEAIASVWRSSPNIKHALVAVQLRDTLVLERALKFFLGFFGEFKYYEIAPGYALYVMERSREGKDRS